jgi:hypothetical protein
MSSKLKDFLVHLAVNRPFRRKYSANPEGFMKESGLTAAERDAVLSRSSQRIRTMLGLKHADTMTQFDSPAQRPPRKGAKKAAKKAKKTTSRKAPSKKSTTR